MGQIGQNKSNKEQDKKAELTYCGAYRTRTDHLNIANVALYQMN